MLRRLMPFVVRGQFRGVLQPTRAVMGVGGAVILFGHKYELTSDIMDTAGSAEATTSLAGTSRADLLDEFAGFYFKAKERGGNPTLRAALMGAFEKRLPQVRQILNMSDEQIQAELQLRLDAYSAQPANAES